MKIRMAVQDWVKRGVFSDPSIYNTEEGLKLTIGDFHSGTTFEGEIDLDLEQEAELSEAMENGYLVVMLLFK